jgi:hypothetical protein
MGTVRRGVPTSLGAPPLSALINSKPESVPVSPHEQGAARGPALSPVYRTSRDATLIDPSLHECMALLHALRSGRALSRDLSRKLLSQRLPPDRATQ